MKEEEKVDGIKEREGGLKAISRKGLLNLHGNLCQLLLLLLFQLSSDHGLGDYLAWIHVFENWQV